MSKHFKICTISFYDGLWKHFQAELNGVMRKWPSNKYSYEFEPIETIFAEGGTHHIICTDPITCFIIHRDLQKLVSDERWEFYKLVIQDIK